MCGIVTREVKTEKKRSPNNRVRKSNFTVHPLNGRCHQDSRLFRLSRRYCSVCCILSFESNHRNLLITVSVSPPFHYSLGNAASGSQMKIRVALLYFVLNFLYFVKLQKTMAIMDCIKVFVVHYLV
jgi:hypothetical protein